VRANPGGFAVDWMFLEFGWIGFWIGFSMHRSPHFSQADGEAVGYVHVYGDGARPGLMVPIGIPLSIYTSVLVL
jgi:hypothetical protein